MTHKRIALFGGSFDPVHRGHLAAAAAAREAAALDEVMFVPCRQSPHKQDGPVAGGEERVDMIDLALEDEGFDWATILALELYEPAPSYSWLTVRTVQALSLGQPGAADSTEWFWILGADQWAAIERWENPDYLRDHLTFLVLARSDFEIVDREGWSFQRIPFDHPASATALREGLGDPDWLTPGVRNYIAEHRLYPQPLPASAD